MSERVESVGCEIGGVVRIGEVAAALTVSTRTVERMIAAGAFPKADRRAGGIRLWRRSTVNRWLGYEDGRVA